MCHTKYRKGPPLIPICRSSTGVRLYRYFSWFYERSWFSITVIHIQNTSLHSTSERHKSRGVCAQVLLTKVHTRRHTFAVAGPASWKSSTDYQQLSGHLTFFRISRTNWKLTSSDGPFLFLFRLSRARATLNCTPCYGAYKKITFYYYYYY